MVSPNVCGLGSGFGLCLLQLSPGPCNVCPSTPVLRSDLFVIKLLKSGKQPCVFPHFFTPAWLAYPQSQIKKQQIKERYTSVPGDIDPKPHNNVFANRLQEHMKGQQDGSAGKGACCQCDSLGLSPRTHVAAGRN